MKDGLSFGSYCTHCNKCHDVRGYCLGIIQYKIRLRRAKNERNGQIF